MNYLNKTTQIMMVTFLDGTIIKRMFFLLYVMKLVKDFGPSRYERLLTSS